MSIKDSIIPALSNNNHELFHSNLWVWLIEKDNKFLKVFFENYDENVKIKVYREKYNTDILIEDANKKCYVIENKLKSIASEEQLNDYQNRIKKHYINRKNEFLLVFLIKNKGLKVTRWKSIDYITIAQRIREVLNQEKEHKEIKKYYYIIKEYCDYVEKVFKEVKESKYVKSKKYNFSLKDSKIKHNGLKVVYQKLKAEKMKENFDKAINFSSIKNKFNKKNLILCSKLGYNNGKPCLTYRVQSENWKVDLKNHSAIEIQIEGNQYRYMVRLIKKSKDRGEKSQNRDKYFNEALNIFKGTKYLCDRRNTKSKKIHGKTSSMKNNYCSYDSGKKTIGIYQYNDIPKNESYKKISALIKNDLKRINGIINKNENINKFLKELK